MHLFGEMLHCRANRVNAILNVGRMIAILPQWKTVQLSKWWSQFWPEARKVAKAVNKQPSEESRHIALRALRHKARQTANRGWAPLFDPVMQ